MATNPLHFNPRAPCGARLEVIILLDGHIADFNPRAPCGARLSAFNYGRESSGISTHAPLAGRDSSNEDKDNKQSNFNPRAPCGARHYRTVPTCNKRDFNPRAPCGARRRVRGNFQRQRFISTHAPLAGRDLTVVPLIGEITKFQPTRPLRGATLLPPFPSECIKISTHAPLAGRDSKKLKFFSFRYYFNPRAPCGARRAGKMPALLLLAISTHAPLAGRDATVLRTGRS